MTEKEKIITSICKVFEDGRGSIRGIAESCLSRVDDFNSEDDIIHSMDAELIYSDDQWEILRYYCDINNANYDYSIECFINDLLRCASLICSL